MSEANKRKSYTAGYKLKVIKFAEERGNRTAERHFGPPPTEKTIRLWRSQKSNLIKMLKSKRAQRGKKAKWPILEDEVKQWIEDNRSKGLAVSTKMIRIHAQKVALKSQINDFKGGPSWCHRFMKCNGLAMRVKTKICQKMPKEYEDKILSFHRYIIRRRQAMDFEIGQIANMDETPMTFDVPSNRSVSKKGQKTITIKTSGHEKSHYTVVLACCADGVELPPMIIFKRKTMPKDKIPTGIIVHVHPKGWMDEGGMKIWINKVWCRRQGGFLKKKALLVLDQFRSHLLDSVEEKFHENSTQLGIIPGGLTSILQPLDVSLNKPFKVFMREKWNDWMMDSNVHKFTPLGALQRPTITQVCEWVKESWSKVDAKMVKKSFLKCGISNALDGSQDHLLYESDTHEDEVSSAEDDSDQIIESSDSNSESDSDSNNDTQESKNL